jgi:hypothetical protein
MVRWQREYRSAVPTGMDQAPKCPKFGPLPNRDGCVTSGTRAHCLHALTFARAASGALRQPAPIECQLLDGGYRSG